MDVELGEVTFPGVDKDFDANSTGVEVETGAYGKIYDAVTDAYGKASDEVPQEQGNKIEVYGLGQKGLTEGMTFVKNDIEKYKIWVPTSMAQQSLEKLIWVKHKVALTRAKHKVAMNQVMTLLLKLVMLVTLTDITMAHKSMKAILTKRWGADAELTMYNEISTGTR